MTLFKKQMLNLLRKIVMFYGVLCFVLILENYHYDVWRENILWFEFNSTDDISVFIIGICYFAIAELAYYINKKFNK